jgi:hypothetical protein
MFEVEKRLKSILEGSSMPTNNDPNVYEDDDDQGGINDEMFVEAAISIFIAESSIVGDLFTESSFDGITLTQLLREMTEEEIRGDVEKKRTRWQKFKEAFKRFFQNFDPYGGLKELKAVNELIKDDMSVGVGAYLPYFLGIPLAIMNRAKKYKDFPEATARQYIAEAKKHREYLNKIVANFEKESDNKYKKAAGRIRASIKHLDQMIIEFDRRSIDKAIL